MAELLTVLAIIGVLAAAASPVFVRTMRDGRVGTAANHIAEVYRSARSRALGRGQCVLVRFNDAHGLPSATDPAGHFTMREAILSTVGDCGPAPSPRCVCTDWDPTTSTDSRFVAAFDERAPQFQPAQAQFFDPLANPQAFCDVAFSPRGRAFVRYGSADAFVPLQGVLRIEVQNTTTTFVRQVIVPPNGAARVVTRM